jgi:hypothetical protein
MDTGIEACFACTQDLTQVDHKREQRLISGEEM